MLVQRLFTISILISSLVQNVSSATYRYTRLLCNKGYETWRCSENEKCGYTNNSCIGDPTKKNEGNPIAGVLIVFLWIAICVGSYLYRIRRRRQVREHITRQLQALVDQSRQQMVVHVIANPSVVNTPAIQEESPPTYEQVTKTKQSKNES